MDDLLDEAELLDCYAYYVDERTTATWDEARSDAERTLAKIRADAWDEGCAAGGRCGPSGDWYIDEEQPHLTTWPYDENPYRDESRRNVRTQEDRQ